MLFVGAISYYVSGVQLEKYIFKNYTDSTSGYVNSLSRSYFDFSESLNLKSAGNVIDFGERILNDNNYYNIAITDANGTIVFSDNKELVDSSVHSEKNWKTAITGVSFVTNINKERKSVTNYIPIISETKNIRGVVYFDSELPDTINIISSFQLEVVTIIIIISTIFMLFTYFVLYELENQMNYQERSITDASKALEEEQKMYEAITTSLAESLIVVNKDGQIMLFNPEAERLTGHHLKDVEYRSYKKIITLYNEESKKIYADPVAEVLKSGHPLKSTSKENYHLKKDTNLVPVNINVSPVKSDKSFIRGVAVTIEDISSEKELQKVKDEFVYLVAHELGNPIFALDGYLNILESSLKNIDKNTKDLLNSAKGINSQLSNLVNDLLEVSRNETGRLNFDLEKIDLVEIFTTVAENERFKAKEEKITLETKKSKLPPVLGNPHKIKEVATNLVNNAIKYTPSGGKVEIYFENNGKEIIANVKDSGIGLSQENQNHLFEKFFRVKDKETEGISGTGLGLFISKQIIEKCGGKIWATSKEGQGSTFSFSLKIAK